MRVRVGLIMVALTAGCAGGGAPVGTPAQPSPTPSATPTPPAQVIGVIGDFGVDAPAPRAVVKVMAGFAPRPLDAVVTTGDNAYQRGTAEQARFARSLLNPVVTTRTRLLASLGNHDIGTENGAPVMRAFAMPARWYVTKLATIEIIVLDANYPRNADQLAFLRRALGAPRDRWRVVAFHQPPMSCSAHTANKGVVEAWLPLFRGRVDLVLTGHNHTYERFRGNDGIPYVTAGGGGAVLYPSRTDRCSGPGRVVRARAVHHAVRLTAFPTRLRVDAWGTDRALLDQFWLTR